MPRKRRAPQPLPTTPAEWRERFKEYPALDVLERRMLDPHDPGTLPIYLWDEPHPACGDLGHALKAKPGAARCRECQLPFRVWYVRWINAAEENRWSTIRSRGYFKVTVAELRDRDDVTGMQEAKTDDPVTRGDRKGEVLVKMPFPYWVEIRRERLAQYNRKRTAKSLKAELVEAVGADDRYGDEAAVSMQRDMQVTEYTRGTSSLAAESRRKLDEPGICIEESGP